MDTNDSKIKATESMVQQELGQGDMDVPSESSGINDRSNMLLNPWPGQKRKEELVCSNGRT